MALKTSIKIKKFWWAPVAADGGAGNAWNEIQIGQREATVQFNGSDADTTNYKNVLGQVLESAITKGDKTLNYQLADLTPDVVAVFTGGTVTDDAEATTMGAPENENQSIELSLRFLTDKNVMVTVPRCSIDAYPIFNDDDLHYYQVNTVALTPAKSGVSIYAMAVLKTPSANDITAFSFAEETGAATIDTGLKTVAIEVANGTSLVGLIPTIAVSLGASLDPASGAAQDYTLPFEYEVEAADGTKVTYTVTVTVAP